MRRRKVHGPALYRQLLQVRGPIGSCEARKIVEEPFCVEASNEIDPEVAARQKEFDTIEECSEFRDKMQAIYQYVWVSELGLFRNRHGTLRLDWVYYWWSENEIWNPLPEVGFGYPFNKQYIVPYVGIGGMLKSLS